MTLSHGNSSMVLFSHIHQQYGLLRGWKDGKMYGRGMFTYANGSEYVGEWVGDGIMYGHGVFKFFTDGIQVYSGEWKDGKFHGHGTLKLKDIQYSGIWKNGQLVRKFGTVITSRSINEVSS